MPKAWMNIKVAGASVLICALLGGDHTARAQATSTPPDVPPADPQGFIAEGRACLGCPRRSVGKALFQTTIINVFYEVANLVRGQVTAHITPKTWWANMEQGWVWDLDDFTVNQIGHPYQGNNYFNAGRANGLSFYESAALTAFGSATWEFFGETNHASLNDFINTTLGGIALGEMFHRAAWLMRDTHKSGRGRLWNEIGATVIDPITGVNRFITGDSSRIVDKPPEMIPSHLATDMSVGALWRGNAESAFEATGQPFFEVDAIYGRPLEGHSRTAYDAFAVRLRFGGGSAISEAKVRGRLLGQPMNGGKLHFAVSQSYDYQLNNAYSTGSESFEGNLGLERALSTSYRFAFLAWGGLTVLGAVDSLPLGVEAPPEEEEGGGDAGQGVSEGPRFYDYGPGSNYGFAARLSRKGWSLASITYEGRQLYSLDGVRANHYLQRGRLDLRVPLRGTFGIGGSAEYFDRRTYFQDEARTTKKIHYPQLRAFFTWGGEK